ncbi:MAG TPA: sensor histidine kinase [Polyangia bacterium]|nr:sensor histidine kinase [Polyangia bacterium]
MASLPRLTAQLRAVARGCGAAIALAGVAAAAAGARGTPLPCAIAFVVAGAALMTRSRGVVTACGALVFAGALVMLTRDDVSVYGAAAFALVGAALLARRLAAFGALRFLARVADGLLLGCLTLALLVLVAANADAPMRLPPALAFVTLAFGALCAAPESPVLAPLVSDSAGGVLARRLYPAVVAIPVALGGLTLARRGVDARLDVALTVGSLLVVVILAQRALERSDARRARLAAVLLEEAERRHLAKELHDEIGQSLTALKLRLSLLPASEPLTQARTLVAELTERVSSLSLDLRPAMLDDLGLLPALIWLVERYTAQTGVRVEFTHAGIEGRVAPAVETAAFRIIQEALTNVARHAAVASVNVRAWRDGRALSVQVVDGGRGFDFGRAIASGKSTGLSGMRERARALGGELTVESSPAGTHLTAELPLMTTMADATDD